MKDLNYICGIIPEDINEEIKKIAIKENLDLHLSQRFFNFNLHVSMKRTFICDQFEEMKEDIKRLLIEQGEISCGNTSLFRNKDMLWLVMDEDEKLRRVHSKIDQFLKQEYNVEIDTFDRNYLPHITIFHKGDPKALETMHQRLLTSLPSFPITIKRYAIGSKNRGNEFFDI